MSRGFVRTHDVATRGLLTVATLSMFTACKREGGEATGQTPPTAATESSQEQQCTKFAADMGQAYRSAGNAMNERFGDGPTEMADIEADAERYRQDLLDKCLTWTPDVLRCLPPADTQVDGCLAILEHAIDGTVPVPKDIPEGPEVAWSLDIGSRPSQLGVLDDGMVVVVTKNELLSLHNGTRAWQRAGTHAPWLLPLAGSSPTWMTADGPTLVAFDPAGSGDRWTAALPPDDDGTTPAVRVGAAVGSGVLVGDAAGRLFMVEPARCADGGNGCLTAEGRLPNTTIDEGDRLLVDGARRFLWNDQTLRGFTSDGQLQLTVGAHDALSQVELSPEGMLLSIDDEVVALDLDRCSAPDPFAVSEWPQPGAFTVGDSECPTCTPPPPDCRRWRIFVESSSHTGFVRMDDGSTVIHGLQSTHAIAAGTVRWKAELTGRGPLATDGARLFGIGYDSDLSGAPVAFEIDSKGTPRWLTKLPADGEDSLLGFGHQVRLSGRWLAMSYQETVVALEVPPS